MSNYSVAEAKNGLPSLLDKALSGEEVLITRRGRVVAELRPAVATHEADVDRAAGLRWLRARRESRPRICVDSTEVLRALGDERGW